MKTYLTNSITITNSLKKRYKNISFVWASYSRQHKTVYLRHEELSFYKIRLMAKYILKNFQEVNGVYTDSNLYTRLSLGIK